MDLSVENSVQFLNLEFEDQKDIRGFMKRTRKENN